MQETSDPMLMKPPSAGGSAAPETLPPAAAPGVAPPADAAGGPFPAQYLFTLNTVIDQQFVGETPGGFRIDLAYSGSQQPPGAVSIRKGRQSTLPQPVLGYMTGASLLSGTDWVSVSREGIVDFDSRITLSLDTKGAAPAAPAEPCLISVRLRGRANLRDALRPNKKPMFGQGDGPPEVITQWRTGFPSGSTLEVKLAVTADVPIEGFDPAQTAVYRQCARLASSLLLGRAKVTFTQGGFGAVSAIKLDLYSL